MADDIAEMQKEMSQLRHDLARVWELLRSEELRLSQLEAGIISVRHGREKPPIVLQAQPGEGAIVFNDAEGRPRGVFQVDEDGAHFEIWNKQGQVVVAIGENKESAGEIYVAGADGKPRAGFEGDARRRSRQCAESGGSHQCPNDWKSRWWNDRGG